MSGGGDDRGGAPGAVLELLGVALSYGAKPALDGVDLSVAGGEVLALLGPNGAGKTSLMRLAAGRLAPGRGRVRVTGGDPARAPAVRRRIGFVPQEIGLYPRLTVAENLDVFAQLAGLGRAARREAAAALLDRFDIAAVAGSVVGTLSGGYRRRVNLAASLVTAPRLILLDEPTQGIDLDARAAIHAALSSLRAEGAAILISTHDFAEAERLADRIAVLLAGRLLREGRLADLMRPLSASAPEQEAVLGEPPGPEAQAVLRRAGLAPRDADPRSAVWLAAPDAADGREGGVLLEYLRALGAPVVEIRLRRPGLEALYRETLSGRGRAGAPPSGRREPEPVA